MRRLLFAASCIAAFASPGAAQRVVNENRIRGFTERADQWGRYRYRDGAMEIEALQGMIYGFWDTATVLIPYYRIQVTAEWRQGREDLGFGLMAGRPTRDASGSAEQLAFKITSDGMFRLSYGSELPIPLRAGEGIRRGPNQRNRLALEVRGALVVVSANGQELGRWTALRPLDGYVGLAMDQGMTAQFRDYRIEELAVPDMVPESVNVDLLAGVAEYDDEWGLGRRSGTALEITARRGHARNFTRVNWLPPRVRIENSWVWSGGPPSAYTGLIFGRPARAAENVLFQVFLDGRYRVLHSRQEVIAPQSHPAIRTGIAARNDLAVEVRGRRVSFFINGTLVNEHSFRDDVVGYAGYEVGEGVNTRLEVLRATLLP